MSGPGNSPTTSEPSVTDESPPIPGSPRQKGVVPSVGAQEPQVVTWRELWVETASRLGGRTVEARWLCEEASGFGGGEWLSGLAEAATERSVARLDAMVARVQTGEPLQYVLGHWAFRHLDLMIDRRVLIPRSETEQVVDVALSFLRTVGAPRLVADIGTGSGAIALSLAQELPFDGTTVWATDISTDALDVARANLAGIGRAAINVRLAHGSLFDALPGDLAGSFDVIVSNPPYVDVDDPALERIVREWEPDVALFGGDDGLAVIRALITDAGPWLRLGGVLVVEIGATQGTRVAELANAAGFVDVEVRLDLAGRHRILVARAAS